MKSMRMIILMMWRRMIQNDLLLSDISDTIFKNKYINLYQLY